MIHRSRVYPYCTFVSQQPQGSISFSVRSSGTCARRQKSAPVDDFEKGKAGIASANANGKISGSADGNG